MNHVSTRPLMICLAIMITIAVSFIGYDWYRLLREGRTKADISSHKIAMRILHRACEDYYSKYSSFPSGANINEDQIRFTTGEGSDNIMPFLCGKLPTGEGGKEESFFTFSTAKNKKAGLLRNQDGTYAEFFDPWGSPYYVLLDYNYDGQLLHPQTKKVFPDCKILIWSPGPDRKSGTPSSDKDDIYYRYPYP